ncbi:MAG: hypothetical protein J3K34DRAFT_455368 [Monoraphidium minutum]|nr:MAG: hypothetical protein J3K34DRAFT_455368 [Monoraphidium minutum]
MWRPQALAALALAVVQLSSVASIAFDPCQPLDPIRKGGPGFVVGIAFWPGGTEADWGDPINGLNPCNETHRANLTAAGAHFATYSTRVDKLSVLKATFPEQLALVAAAPPGTPLVVSAVAFSIVNRNSNQRRGGVRSEARYVVSGAPPVTGGTGFVATLSLMSKFELGVLKYLQFYNLTCNDCGGWRSNRCINGTSCTMPVTNCTCAGAAVPALAPRRPPPPPAAADAAAAPAADAAAAQAADASAAPPADAAAPATAGLVKPGDGAAAEAAAEAGQPEPAAFEEGAGGERRLLQDAAAAAPPAPPAADAPGVCNYTDFTHCASSINLLTTASTPAAPPSPARPRCGRRHTQHTHGRARARGPRRCAAVPCGGRVGREGGGSLGREDAADSGDAAARGPVAFRDWRQVRKLNSYSLVALFAQGKDLFFDMKYYDGSVSDTFGDLRANVAAAYSGNAEAGRTTGGSF